eukprot:g1010.t1
MRARFARTSAISAARVRRFATESAAKAKSTATSTAKAKAEVGSEGQSSAGSALKSNLAGGAGGVSTKTRTFLEVTFGIAAVYGGVWAAQHKFGISPTKFSMQHMLVSGAGISYAALARGGFASRRILVGAMSISYAGLNELARVNKKNTESSTLPKKPKKALMEFGTIALTSLPMLFASASRRPASPALGAVWGLGALCLAGICSVRMPEMERVWKPLQKLSRHPDTFLEWAHWFSYRLMGGGIVVPGLLLLPYLYGGMDMNEDDLVLPSPPGSQSVWELERGASSSESPREGGDNFSAEFYRRTTPAFFPWKNQAREMSRRHLFETVQTIDVKVSALHGEWYTASPDGILQSTPFYDFFLRRSEGQARVTIVPKPSLGGASVEFDIPGAFVGRRFLMQVGDEPGKFGVSPLPGTWTTFPQRFLESDSFRLDRNRLWIIDGRLSEGPGDQSDDDYIVIADGDARSRLEILSRSPTFKLGQKEKRELVLRLRSKGFDL